jgi:hypothetical protein
MVQGDCPRREACGQQNTERPPGRGGGYPIIGSSPPGAGPQGDHPDWTSGWVSDGQSCGKNARTTADCNVNVSVNVSVRPELESSRQGKKSMIAGEWQASQGCRLHTGT